MQDRSIPKKHITNLDSPYDLDDDEDWQMHGVPIGSSFYLIRREAMKGAHVRSTDPKIYTFRHAPGKTNLSHEPRARGWLGTTDDVYMESLGRFRVTGESKTHVHLRDVTDEEEE